MLWVFSDRFHCASENIGNYKKLQISKLKLIRFSENHLARKSFAMLLLYKAEILLNYYIVCIPNTSSIHTKNHNRIFLLLDLIKGPFCNT